MPSIIVNHILFLLFIDDSIMINIFPIAPHAYELTMMEWIIIGRHSKFPMIIDDASMIIGPIMFNSI